MRNGLAAVVALVLAVGGCTNLDRNGGDDEDSDENEVQMTMDQLPANVRDGFTREAGAGLTLGEIEREEENGQLVYEADATGADGQKWEITLDETGKLLSKEKDDEEGGEDDD